MNEALLREQAAHVARLDEAYPRVVEKLKDLGATFILLFGSYAQGRRDLFTDIDMIAVMESDLPWVERQGFVYMRVKPGCALDLLVYTPEEFEAVKGRPFFQHALATGKVVYEAGT